MTNSSNCGVFKHSFILLLFLFTSVFAGAQDYSFQWVRTFGSSNGTKLALDSNKSIYVLGNFGGTVDFDGGSGVFNMTATSGNDIYITKNDTAGHFIWAKQLDGQLALEADGLQLDKAGNVYILGNFQSPVDFDPGPGEYLVTAASNVAADMAVLKLDKAANFIWIRQIKYLGSTNVTPQPLALQSGPEGSIYFGGGFSSTMDFDPGTGTTSLTAGGEQDAFLMKLGADGSFGWAHQFGAAGSDKIIGLVVDNAGNAYSMGGFQGSVDFDPGAANYSLNAGALTTCFISKLDKDGLFVYAKAIQSDYSNGQSLARDSSNNLYLSGTFADAVDLDPGPDTHSVAGGSLFTVKLDENGNFVWGAAYLSDPGNYFATSSSDIQIDVLKNVYTTGAFYGAVDFDPGPGVHEETISGTYLHKLSQCGNSLNILSIDTCNAYTLNTVTYTKPGTYYQLLPNAAGCDSIIQINIAPTKLTSQFQWSPADLMTGMACILP